jgi:muconolactone D-isomerase
VLFLVHMEVRLPPDMPAGQAEDLKARERELAQSLQRDGRWVHLWRIVGRYANASVFDVGSHDELHDLLSGLPLFPYMDIVVTPLARHPSAIDPEERRAS